MAPSNVILDLKFSDSSGATEHFLDVELTQMSMRKSRTIWGALVKRGMAAESRVFPGFSIQLSNVHPPNPLNYLHGILRKRV